MTTPSVREATRIASGNSHDANRANWFIDKLAEETLDPYYAEEPQGWEP